VGFLGFLGVGFLLPTLPTCGECSLVGAGASGALISTIIGVLISTMIGVGPLVSSGGAVEDWASLLLVGVVEDSRIWPSGLTLYLSRSAKNPPDPDVSFPSAFPLVPSSPVAPKSPLSRSFLWPDSPLQNKRNINLRWPTCRFFFKVCGLHKENSLLQLVPPGAST
jgi:hypothetical protein